MKIINLRLNDFELKEKVEFTTETNFVPNK